tara:strand:- start:43 stop:534 length:492 start_codon:yes stop_codon:yes gene_type:complete
MLKHSFIYNIIEEYVEVDNETKSKLKKIKLNKDKNIPSMNLTSYWDMKEEDKLINLLNFKFKSILKKYKLKIEESWVQKYLNNSYHHLHTHYVHKKSFVWFIEGNKKSSPLCFYDVGYPLVDTQQSLEFPFIPGTLLIFPGFIPHEVKPNSNNKRLIVSGNVF